MRQADLSAQADTVEMELNLQYRKTGDLLADAEQIIETAQNTAYHAVNLVLVRRNWLLGKRIAEELLHGKERAQYGAEVITGLSEALTERYGKGYNKSNLYLFYNFYRLWPEIFHTVCGKSPQMLEWSHYRILIQVSDPAARAWYEREAYTQAWSVRTLQRNVNTLYYERLLMSGNQQPVQEEMQSKTAKDQETKPSFVRNPYVLEFLGVPESASVTENVLESAIISNLRSFLMELGKGYAFVARQYHIHTEKEDYYIDLVFYNYILKCFVLIDLKMNKITHQDVGQMDMYVRMFDELRRVQGDNPTLGIVLCSETDEDIARYSVLKGSEQLFASKYKLFLPSEEELRAEIEAQKEIFFLQHPEFRKNDAARDGGI